MKEGFSVSENLSARPSLIAWFLHPYIQLAMGALLVTASELLLRHGAQGFHEATQLGRYFGIAALGSVWTWLGIITYVLSFASWLYVLRYVPLSIAFPAINGVHVLVPIGAWIILGEHVSFGRWAGIGLVVLGILLIVRPVVVAEEKL